MEGTGMQYAGQPIAYVVAETVASARRSARLTDATYEEKAFDIRMDPDKRFVIGAQDDSKGMVTTKGDVARGLTKAAKKVGVEYTAPFQHHHKMTMVSATAKWRGDRLTVWMPSQSVRTPRAGIAGDGLPETSVRVISPFVGCAFGSKAGITPIPC